MISVDVSQEARQAVLAEYRKQRQYDRPFLAMNALLNRYALNVAIGAELGSGTEDDVAKFAAARSYRTAIYSRKKAQAKLRGVPVYESFWHHGVIGGRP